VWGSVREEFTRESGGRWHEGAQAEMMGMSSREWSRYMAHELGVPMEPEEISAAAVARIEQRYRERVPLLPGALETVRALALHWPLGLASSANRPLIDLVLELTRLASLFRATLSSEEVARGKPAPDVYLEVARRIGVDPHGCAAVEDSTNGILAASRAGMRVVAVPRPDYPPSREALGRASLTIGSLRELTPEALQALAA
jgi:HAD superfamily hydrolase (TIGR01509 family)